MIQCQRVSISGSQEVWYLSAAMQKLYRLAEVHCELDHGHKTVWVSVFMAENCPHYRDLVDYFVDQTIPTDYSFMVRLYTRGMVVDSWTSAESPDRDADGLSALGRAAAACAPKVFGA